MRKIAFFFTLLLALFVLTAPTTVLAQVSISVAFGPPPLPVYEQPICPGDGYIWTPGYWAWDDDDGDYYWVPGTWVLAPEVGYLWTPPWWGWSDGVFLFHEGYWGPHVGFYGGVVYGFGYFGVGFEGGRWDGDRFFYNRSVTNINVVNIHNVYNQTVINNSVTVNRVSYNGGPEGIKARPRPEEVRAAHERHIPPVTLQAQHMQTARSNPELRSSANRGRPLIAATPRPAEFRDNAVVPAREAGGPYHPPDNHGGAATHSGNGGSSPAVHPKDLPSFERPAPPNNGDSNRDRKYQQEQDKLFAKQEQERQKLQQKQDQEHQRMERQNTDTARRQQTEQRHQQQTEQLQQKHVQEQQRLQEKKNPNRPK
jgi:hypothetical protein